MHRNASRLPVCVSVPNPFVAKCFGFPSSAWARHIYLLPERTLEPASDGSPGPAIGAVDFTGQRVGDRPGAAVHVFSSCSYLKPALLFPLGVNFTPVAPETVGSLIIPEKLRILSVKSSNSLRPEGSTQTNHVFPQSLAQAE
jgi:hypothetical protein